jgi:hypothetical protein
LVHLHCPILTGQGPPSYDPHQCSHIAIPGVVTDFRHHWSNWRRHQQPVQHQAHAVRQHRAVTAFSLPRHQQLRHEGVKTKSWVVQTGKNRVGKLTGKGNLHKILNNPVHRRDAPQGRGFSGRPRGHHHPLAMGGGTNRTGIQATRIGEGTNKAGAASRYNSHIVSGMLRVGIPPTPPTGGMRANLIGFLSRSSLQKHVCQVGGHRVIPEKRIPGPLPRTPCAATVVLRRGSQSQRHPATNRQGGSVTWISDSKANMHSSPVAAKA